MKTIKNCQDSVVENYREVFNSLVTLKKVSSTVENVYYYYKTAINKVAEIYGIKYEDLLTEVSEVADEVYAERSWGYKEIQSACNLLQERKIIDEEGVYVILKKAYESIEKDALPSDKKEFAKQHPTELMTLALLLRMAEENLLELQLVKNIAKRVASKLYFNSDALWEMVIKLYGELDVKGES